MSPVFQDKSHRTLTLPPATPAFEIFPAKLLDPIPVDSLLALLDVPSVGDSSLLQSAFAELRSKGLYKGDTEKQFNRYLQNLRLLKTSQKIWSEVGKSIAEGRASEFNLLGSWIVSDHSRHARIYIEIQEASDRANAALEKSLSFGERRHSSHQTGRSMDYSGSEGERYNVPTTASNSSVSSTIASHQTLSDLWQMERDALLPTLREEKFQQYRVAVGTHLAIDTLPGIFMFARLWEDGSYNGLPRDVVTTPQFKEIWELFLSGFKGHFERNHWSLAAVPRLSGVEYSQTVETSSDGHASLVADKASAQRAEQIYQAIAASPEEVKAHITLVARVAAELQRKETYNLPVRSLYDLETISEFLSGTNEWYTDHRTSAEDRKRNLELLLSDEGRNLYRLFRRTAGAPGLAPKLVDSTSLGALLMPLFGFFPAVVDPLRAMTNDRGIPLADRARALDSALRLFGTSLAKMRSLDSTLIYKGADKGRSSTFNAGQVSYEELVKLPSDVGFTRDFAQEYCLKKFPKIKEEYSADFFSALIHAYLTRGADFKAVNDFLLRIDPKRALPYLNFEKDDGLAELVRELGRFNRVALNEIGDFSKASFVLDLGEIDLPEENNGENEKGKDGGTGTRSLLPREALELLRRLEAWPFYDAVTTVWSPNPDDKIDGALLFSILADKEYLAQFKGEGENSFVDAARAQKERSGALAQKLFGANLSLFPPQTADEVLSFVPGVLEKSEAFTAGADTLQKYFSDVFAGKTDFSGEPYAADDLRPSALSILDDFTNSGSVDDLGKFKAIAEQVEATFQIPPSTIGPLLCWLGSLDGLEEKLGLPETQRKFRKALAEESKTTTDAGAARAAALRIALSIEEPEKPAVNPPQ